MQLPENLKWHSMGEPQHTDEGHTIVRYWADIDDDTMAIVAIVHKAQKEES